uniref:Uncharacterized protein n=1 Tax=Tetraselmis sp. GSL018 TaxID=582737 RepID=A0A061R5W9_9CHLO
MSSSPGGPPAEPSRCQRRARCATSGEGSAAAGFGASPAAVAHSHRPRRAPCRTGSSLAWPRPFLAEAVSGASPASCSTPPRLASSERPCALPDPFSALPHHPRAAAPGAAGCTR